MKFTILVSKLQKEILFFASIFTTKRWNNQQHCIPSSMNKRNHFKPIPVHAKQLEVRMQEQIKM